MCGFTSCSRSIKRSSVSQRGRERALIQPSGPRLASCAHRRVSKLCVQPCLQARTRIAQTPAPNASCQAPRAPYAADPCPVRDLCFLANMIVAQSSDACKDRTHARLSDRSGCAWRLNWMAHLTVSLASLATGSRHLRWPPRRVHLGPAQAGALLCQSRDCILQCRAECPPDV